MHAPGFSAHASVGHYENFPVASWLCPARLRAPIRAIYAFARTADDLADEGTAPAHLRLEALSRYRAALESTLAGAPPTLAPWPALHEALVDFGLPAQALHDLLSAFEQDVVTVRYADFATLADYCRRSANPIGRLLLHLYGIADRAAHEQSDAICTALQLINFWQDVAVDARKNPPHGRIYLPQESLARFGVADDQILAGRYDARVAALLAHECERAERLMLRGAPLVHRVPGRLGFELRLVVQGGLGIVRKLRARRFDVFTRRPVLTALDAPGMLLRALLMRPPALPAPGPALRRP
jgi:squalene synthase HpnC